MKMGRVFIFLAVVILVVAAGAVFHLLCRPGILVSGHKELLEELEQMNAESRKAVIIKRVSEQLEEMAYQQKDISDREW